MSFKEGDSVRLLLCKDMNVSLRTEWAEWWKKNKNTVFTLSEYRTNGNWFMKYPNGDTVYNLRGGGDDPITFNHTEIYVCNPPIKWEEDLFEI